MVKQDRRIRKTKAVLKSALLSLMAKKNINHITVKELCEKADINRGTFYLHYKDTLDLLEQIEDEILQNLSDYLAIPEGEILSLSEDNLRDIFQFVRDNSDFCQVMLTEKGEIGFVRKLVDFLSHRFTAYCENIKVAEHYYCFMIHGFLGIIGDWLSSGMTETIDNMAKICYNIISNKQKELLI